MKKYIYPEDHGAKGDGITDDTEAFRKTQEKAMRTGRPVWLSGDKLYLIKPDELWPDENLRARLETKWIH